MQTQFADTKVLPFETAQGHVAGHEIRRYHYDWMKGAIKSVVFQDFNEAAQMQIETVVHWTRWTQWTKKVWPAGGTVVAVILENDQRIHAEMMFVGNHTNASYNAAPMVCRDGYKIVTLGKSHRLLEVVGVEAWMSNGKPLVDPWERDNAAFRAKHSA